MEITKLTNHFIIAMPAMLDENFDRTVTYICEHDENGSFGLTINRPTEITLEDIFYQMGLNTFSSKKESFPSPDIYLGGPMQQNRGFILHSPSGNWSSTLKINDNIALTSSRDILEAISNEEGPEQSFIAVGYAGWGPGQLEYEITANAWLSCPADEQILFNTPHDQRWQGAAKLLGVDLGLMSSDSGHA
jgi:putative transcriptional regulator